MFGASLSPFTKVATYVHPIVNFTLCRAHRSLLSSAFGFISMDFHIWLVLGLRMGSVGGLITRLCVNDGHPGFGWLLAEDDMVFVRSCQDPGAS